MFCFIAERSLSHKILEVSLKDVLLVKNLLLFIPMILRNIQLEVNYSNS